jgi:hypothetical protein
MASHPGGSAIRRSSAALAAATPSQGKLEMPVITKHDPGMLCWADLQTRDLDGAKRFYRELFGWTLRSQPMPGGEYVMALQDDLPVVGMASLSAEAAHIPNHWNVYIDVESADEGSCSRPRSTSARWGAWR